VELITVVFNDVKTEETS